MRLDVLKINILRSVCHDDFENGLSKLLPNHRTSVLGTSPGPVLTYYLFHYALMDPPTDLQRIRFWIPKCIIFCKSNKLLLLYIEEMQVDFRATEVLELGILELWGDHPAHVRYRSTSGPSLEPVIVVEDYRFVCLGTVTQRKIIGNPISTSSSCTLQTRLTRFTPYEECSSYLHYRKD